MLMADSRWLLLPASTSFSRLSRAGEWHSPNRSMSSCRTNDSLRSPCKWTPASGSWLAEHPYRLVHLARHKRHDCSVRAKLGPVLGGQGERALLERVMPSRRWSAAGDTVAVQRVGCLPPMTADAGTFDAAMGVHREPRLLFGGRLPTVAGGDRANPHWPV